MALTGGVVSAAVVRDRASAVALLGLLSVLAVAVRHAVLQLRQYEAVKRAGHAHDANLVVSGAQDQFGWTVTSVLAAGLALVPLAVYGSVAGLEVAGPLALVIIGGLLSTVLVNLFALPGLYLMFGQKRRTAAQQPQPTTVSA